MTKTSNKVKPRVKKKKSFSKQQLANLSFYSSRRDNDYIADLYGMTESEFADALESDNESMVAYKKGRHGRPSKMLTPSQIEELEYNAGRLSDEEIADLYGMAHETFKKVLKEDPLLIGSYKKGKAKTSLQMTNVIIDAALGGNAPMACFYKKCRNGWREVKEPKEELGDTNTTVTLKLIGSDGQLVNPSQDIIENEQK